MLWLLELVWRPQAEPNADAFEHSLHGLLACWLHNGQIGDEYLLARENDGWRVVLEVPEPDALSDEHDSIYAAKDREALRTLAASDFVIGRSSRSVDGDLPCGCAASSSLILRSGWGRRSSPIMCGDCCCPVPLYRLPPVKGEDHYSVWSWMRSYKAADTLYMNSGALEAEAEKELGSWNSHLNGEARRIASILEASTGKPVFRYLFRSYSDYEPRADTTSCPSCSAPWRLERPWATFDFKCEACRIVADEVRADQE